jgi:lycopene cyclase domain-containing protein
VSLYLLINLLAISVPFVVSFDRRIQLMKHWKALIFSITASAIPYLIWDQYFTDKAYWGFNADYLLGIYLYDLPIEEVLFFICIPFACIFTHVSILKIKAFTLTTKTTTIISALVLALSIGLLLFNLDKAYTVWVTLFTLMIHIIAYTYYRDLLRHFYITFLFMLIPFFLVNGVLTGMGIDGEVVWYNNLENLGIRIVTIPVEDTFYAYSMILLNLIIFKRSSTNKDLIYKEIKEN